MAYLDTEFALQESDVVRITNSQRTAIEFMMTVSIANEATWLYRNLKYPRYKNFYGYAQIMSGAFVVRVVPLTFLNQEILHWRDIAFYINDTTLCSVKALGAAMTPPVTGFAINVKTRQRFTSVRFRLLPGIVANCSLVWEIGDSACGNLVEEPDERQGQPPIPNNSGASGNPRPTGQTGDELDPSNNDGNDDPNDGKPDAPKPGNGAGTGNWKVQFSYYTFEDQFVNTTANIPSNDRFATVTARAEPVPGGTNVAGKSDRKLIYTINGVDVDSGGSGFGMNVFTPYYQ